MRARRIYLATTVALAVVALVAAAIPSFAAGPDLTGPGPDRQQQIRVLTAALATMARNYASLSTRVPGVEDIDDYGIGALWKRGIDGAGTTIAVIEGWDDPSIAGVVARFDQPLGLPDPRIQTVYPAGRLPVACPPGMVKLGDYGSCSAWGDELELDVEAAHLIAPYAKILISVTPADTEVTDDAASQVAPPEMMKAVETISTQHLANVISISDGTGESTYSYGAAEIRAQDPGELTAAAAGVPVVAGTGDCGVVQNLAVASAQCEDTSGTPDTGAWDDSPWVTAVGGTVPDLGARGQRLGPDPMWHVGVFSAGAGFSAVYSRPSYQDLVASITGSAMRSVPDISMDASDGTSEATPLLAGVLALATQANGANVGPVNPALYQALGPAGSAGGIADVVSGNNSVLNQAGHVVVRGFAAGPGFDVASGWGTLYAPAFVPALAAVTRASGQEAAARRQAAAALSALEHRSIQLARTGAGGLYVRASGFLPAHPVRLRVDGALVATLRADPLGDVYATLSGLAAARHMVSLDSMLITETIKS